MKTMNNPDQLIAKREELFIRLYKKAFPAVAGYISRRGGSFDEAKDVFQDALVIYYEKTINAVTNETAYLIGIAKHLWLKRYQDNDQNIPLENIDVSVDMDESPSSKRIMHFLEKAGSKCMDLLKGFYYDQLPLTDLATAFGFSGVRSATVQKYKCLEKVRETIKQKALQYEDFME
ncbi:RNA polymerase sigma factor [Mucilaginibacter sp. X5P1]|uniref:RNA polymerase sigma factor n=1 Tax=Mucilaginibacter sp. X5P1 TaxID=2723088 RepID=UPI00181B40F0|nr:sigma-70 family RNA polymerase sigma factor [Mucilaginibacter sp. X5P1]MBB6140641.1 DNA-directed RNA polymerase specialized sigma24 family protein [Mucilaginibacter sp. X5P1]